MLKRRPIRQLPNSVVAQVAAGEVVERPASIVKELIENSLDAGATEITIEVEKAGRDLILVADNGHGIPESEILLAIQPHATSKLETVQDLCSLQSYGFRGEALASIAAISALRLETKPAEAPHGFFLETENGELQQGSLGMNNGTRIQVRKLFQRLPARQKFLKGESTEWRHILSVIQSQAMTHPEVGWKVAHNRKQVLDLPAGQNRINRLLSLIGEGIHRQFLPLEKSVPHFGISGYVSLPQFATSLRQQQLFINQRPVQSQLVQQAVRAAYAQLVELDANPAFFLWLDLPPETVDINIHPRKETVRFLDEKTVKELVYTAIHDSLSVSAEQAASMMSQHAWLIKEGSTSSTLGKELKQTVLAPRYEKNEEIGQLHNLFLVQETETGVQFIDQHAAHERILFEKFLQSYQDKRQQLASIELEVPLSFQTSALETQLLEEQEPELKNLGFELEPWPNNTFLIRRIPAVFQDRDIIAILREVLQDLSDEKPLAGIDTATQKMLAYLACRSAIKAGQKLSLQERTKLLTELRQTPRNFTCPHGRPIAHDFSLEQLYSLFKRR